MVAEDSVWMYEPSFALSVFFTVVYGLIFLSITYLTFIRYRAWYFTPVVVGAFVEVVAYVARTYSAKHQSVIAPFVVSLTLTVLAPVFIAAANYMLISRLILAVLPPSRHRVLGIPGHRLTLIFVCFDIIAFLVQGSGSSIASSNDWTGDTERIGRYVLIGGLSFQFAAFSLFLCVFGRFHFVANLGSSIEAPPGWRKLVRAVYVSSILIMIRCIFRVAEFSEGMNGYAFKNEWLFWVFEALPMAPAIGIFCFYHPSRYLGKHSSWKLHRAHKSSDVSEMETLQDSSSV